ncbi:hypothetical protein Hanom_Chr00s000001g01594881 [Helianthus anomalus]
MQLCFVTSYFFVYQVVQSNDSFYSHMSNQTSQWNGMIHFIPLSIPLPRSFHSLIYSITPIPNRP